VHLLLAVWVGSERGWLAEARVLLGGSVSTYDIAVALLFQAAYADESTNHGPINMCGMIDIRNVLAGFGPSLVEPRLALNTVWWSAPIDQSNFQPSCPC